jgi:hypothetical protein
MCALCAAQRILMVWPGEDTIALLPKHVLYVVSMCACLRAPRGAHCGFRSCDNASASALGEPWIGSS